MAMVRDLAARWATAQSTPSPQHIGEGYRPHLRHGYSKRRPTVAAPCSCLEKGVRDGEASYAVVGGRALRRLPPEGRAALSSFRLRCREPRHRSQRGVGPGAGVHEPALQRRQDSARHPTRPQPGRGPLAKHRRLTWQGHDLLDAIRNEQVWAQTKTTVIGTVGSVTVDVLKNIVGHIAMNMLGFGA
jgi:hypothetical protein